MFKIASILTSLSLLAAASISAAPPVPEILITAPDATASSLESVSLLAMNELAQLTGSAPDWVVAGCAALGGFGTGWGLAKKLAKRAVLGAACPACPWIMAGVGVACLLI